MRRQRVRTRATTRVGVQETRASTDAVRRRPGSTPGLPKGRPHATCGAPLRALIGSCPGPGSAPHRPAEAARMRLLRCDRASTDRAPRSSRRPSRHGPTCTTRDNEDGTTTRPRTGRRTKNRDESARGRPTDTCRSPRTRCDQTAAHQDTQRTVELVHAPRLPGRADAYIEFPSGRPGRPQWGDCCERPTRRPWRFRAACVTRGYALIRERFHRSNRSHVKQAGHAMFNERHSTATRSSYNESSSARRAPVTSLSLVREERSAGSSRWRRAHFRDRGPRLVRATALLR